VTKWQTLANEHMYDPAHARSRTVQPIGGNFQTGSYFKNVPHIYMIRGYYAEESDAAA